MSAPLTGLKAFECARIIAGPWIGQIPGCFEAKVNRVVNSQGDNTRKWGTPFNDCQDDQLAAYFHCTIFRKDCITFENTADLKNWKISLPIAILWSTTSKSVKLINLGWTMKA